MINSKLLYLLLVLLSVFFANCNSTEECREDRTVKLRIGVYTKETPTDKALTVDSVWLNGLEKDSFIYNNSKSVSTLKLPLNAARQQADFIVRFNNITDTLSVFYTNNNAYFISLACGCIATQTIDEVITTNHFIDSVRIVERKVINVDAENIKILHN